MAAIRNIEQEHHEHGVQIAILSERVKSLTEITSKQNEVIANIAKDIHELRLMAERSKGAFWALLGVGGLMGAFISNIKNVVDVLRHTFF